MKDYDFKVKIADFLLHPGNTDTVEIEKKFSTKIPQLVESGIDASVEVIGLDEKTLLITLKEATTQIETTCDTCGEEMEHPLEARNASIKVFVGDKEKEVETPETMFIEPGTGVVDLEDFIVDSLLLKDSVKHTCQKCVDREVDTSGEEPSGSIKRDFTTKS